MPRIKYIKRKQGPKKGSRVATHGTTEEGGNKKQRCNICGAVTTKELTPGGKWICKNPGHKTKLNKIRLLVTFNKRTKNKTS